MSHTCDSSGVDTYKLLVACVGTVERETGSFKVPKHELVLYETLTHLFPPCFVFCWGPNSIIEYGPPGYNNNNNNN